MVLLHYKMEQIHQSERLQNQIKYMHFHILILNLMKQLQEGKHKHLEKLLQENI